MLHVAYLMVPLGFLGVSAGALGLATPAIAAHLFGIGAIGGMTIAVMMRATLGHTGRPLVSDPVLSGAFLLLAAATAVRLIGGHRLFGELDGTSTATILWTACFALLAWRLGPWLARPKVDRRKPSQVS